MIFVLVSLVSLMVVFISVDVGGSVNYYFGLVNESFDSLSFQYDSNLSLNLLIMLLVCGILSISYVFHYLRNWRESVLLVLIMIIFILVMMMLVLSGNLVSTLILWEYLGLVSFFLILYYGSWVSYRGGTITLVCSRFGDVALFFLVGYSIGYGGGLSLIIIGFLVWLVVGSKSALFPFTSWLLEAMRAPTPVSSLVHSSTLVAAGIWFYLNYSSLLGVFVFDYSWMVLIILVSSILSIIVSGVCSLICNDIKQVVALSTCSNISWIVVMLILGENNLALVQLIVHGLSKCMVFIVVGDYISCSSGGQIINQLVVNIFGSIRDFIFVFFLVIGLSGFPFMGLYFGKHLFIGSMYSVNLSNLGLDLILELCFVLSMIYSVRFMLLLDGNGVSCVSSVRCLYNLSWLFLLSGSLIGIYLCFLEVEGCFHLYNLDSMYLLICLSLGFMVGVYLSYVYIYKDWLSNLMGLDIVVWLFSKCMIMIIGLYQLVMFRWEISLFEWVCSVINISVIRWCFNLVLLNLSVIIVLFSII
uniref:NADH:ubiquinone reductase (H(+)-translocating) n=1 Tax=Schistosoma spindalis TaxID=6189 RepID=Q1I0M0_SCHSI|nr:NADH dehydrogenase subunit 5 [Schistosoma spindale]AAZ57328.1 NADH dehydrogenase subunit 5 [Schistosoma spindale]